VGYVIYSYVRFEQGAEAPGRQTVVLDFLSPKSKDKELRKCLRIGFIDTTLCDSKPLYSRCDPCCPALETLMLGLLKI
jgi:hypothetical protein